MIKSDLLPAHGCCACADTATKPSPLHVQDTHAAQAVARAGASHQCDRLQ